MTDNPPINDRTRRWPRLYASTWVVMGLLTVVLALLNCPGQAVEEPWIQLQGAYGHTQAWLHHGWPLTVIRRGPFYSPPSPWTTLDFVDSFDPIAFALDAAIAIGVIGAGGILFQAWRRRGGSLRRFRLSTFFLFVALVALALGYIGRLRAAGQADRSAVRALMQSSPRRAPSVVWQRRGPTWLRNLLGEGLFAGFDRAIAFDDLPATDLAAALPLRRLEVISLSGTVSNADLEFLESFPNLECLAFHGGVAIQGNGEAPETSLTIPRLKNLRGLHVMGTFRGDGLENVPRLEYLDLTDSDVADDALAKIGTMRNLEQLNLVGTAVTGAGLAHLVKLPKLRVLHLGGGRDHQRDSLITDDAVPSLSQLIHLRYLELDEARMTVRGRAALRMALPNCEMYGE